MIKLLRSLLSWTPTIFVWLLVSPRSVSSTFESGTFVIGTFGSDFHRPPQTGVLDNYCISDVSALRSLSVLRCVVTLTVASAVVLKVVDLEGSFSFFLKLKFLFFFFHPAFDCFSFMLDSLLFSYLLISCFFRLEIVSKLIVVILDVKSWRAQNRYVSGDGS